ncbi:MAG: nucleoside/nucleotide kinase family protein [Pseudomonadota bacterium]
MSEIVTQDALIARLQALAPGRHLVAIAGAPASGKSGLAKAVVDGLNRDHPDQAAVLPMDGYHYDDQLLDARGHRPRKGAPHTFDVAGLRHMLKRLRANEDPEVAIPLFDRSIEIARAGASVIPQRTSIIVVEGNYLLLDKPPWDSLASLFDLTVALDVPEDVLRERLTQRWIHYQLSPDEITAKLEDNDLPNGRLIREASRAPDLIVRHQ